MDTTPLTDPVVLGAFRFTGSRFRMLDGIGVFDARLGDLFLDSEPTTPGSTWSRTVVDGKTTQEKWVRTAGATNLKIIDYTYSGTRVSTEVRKVYADDGTTIVAQMTLTYSYTGSSVTGIATTRDV
jgi:hypothetical protein